MIFCAWSAAYGATLTANPNPIPVTYGATSGTTTLSWNATDLFQAGGYKAIEIYAGSVPVCAGSSATGSCGSGTINSNQNFTLYGVYNNGGLVYAASLAVSVVDAKPLVSIDKPDTTTTYLGGVLFGGWAVDHLYPISYVQVSIDGTSIGNAGYGGSRPDVCSTYPAAQSCPNVGYSISVDTAKLSGGNHTITVTAVDTHGDSNAISRTFKVQQAITNYSIDKPDTSTYLGEAHFGGWAVDNAYPISSVAVSIDGTSYGNATYGGARQDVCTALGNQPGCPNVGWDVLIDTAKLVGGTHTFAITVTTADGRQTSGNKPFNVQQAYTNIGIGLPQTNQPYYGVQSFAGWAIDDAFPISSVGISIDGVSYGNASYGGSRPDVCNTYPGRPGCPNVGWSLAVDMNALNPSNNHTLLVTATTTDGRQQSQSRTFASGLAATSVHIDLPVSQQPYSGTQTFSGWAYDNVSTISSVSLAIDGAAVGNAAYGAVRSDVCSAGQYPGCPNVGWNYAIDTSQFTSGLHTLVVTATTTDSRTQTANVQFYVGDQSAPSREYIYQNGKVIAIENQH